jgi:uncharacterized protein YjbI with pentapeptide repeats
MSWKMTAEELLERYAAGERDFAGIDLHGVDLSQAVLRGINLDRADLSEVNFTGADLSGDYGRSLSPLFQETPGISTYPGKYSSSGLGNAPGGYTCIRYAVLTNANFRDADISYVDFSHSDLSFVNFNRTYGDGVAFEYAWLSWSKWDDWEDCGIGISSFEGANVEGTPLENAEWV